MRLKENYVLNGFAMSNVDLIHKRLNVIKFEMAGDYDQQRTLKT